MSEKSIKNRNAEIAAMLSDGNHLRNFYRFAAQNPHIEPYEACQIVIARPDASVCFSFEEWNAMDRRVTRGRRGIPYYDREGNKGFVFDADDTNGEARYQRLFFPMKRMLIGLDELNGTSLQSDGRNDYRKIHRGVQAYLRGQGGLTGDDTYDGLLIEGTAYSLYCRTGFPKDSGIALRGFPYSYRENADLFKEIYITAALMEQEIEDAYQRKTQAVNLIDDTEEETVTDEPIISEKQTVGKDDEQTDDANTSLERAGSPDEGDKVRGKIFFSQSVKMYAQDYVILTKQDPAEAEKVQIYVGKAENLEPSTNAYDNSDGSLVYVSDRPQMPFLLYGRPYAQSQQELIDDGTFTEEDYREYARIKDGAVRDILERQPLKFGVKGGSGVPFRYPNWQDEAAPVEQTEEAPTEQVEKSKYQPFYQRYLDEQNKHPNAVVIQRMGDFYEVFGDKAIQIADDLELTLTGRMVAPDERVPMVGFPYHISERYTEKILEKSPIVWIEDEKSEAMYILSHEEAVGKKPTLTVLDDDEPNPFDDEEQPDYVGDIDTRFPIKDEYEDDEDDIPDASEWEDDPEDLRDEEEPEPVKKEKGKRQSASKNETRIKDRKRKEKPQPSLFDYFLPEEKSPQEQLIEHDLKRGSGVVDGKFRIYEKCQENPTIDEFATFLKKEYGTGGRYTEYSQAHSPKGITLKYIDDKNPDNSILVNLKWNEVAVRIADLIDDGKYLSEREKEEYPKYVAEQERKRQEREQAEKEKTAFIGKIITGTTAERKQRILDEYAKTTKLETFADFLLKEYGTSSESGNDYRANYNGAGVWFTRYDSVGHTKEQYSLSWREFADRLCTLIEDDRYIDGERQERSEFVGRDLDAEDDEDWENLIKAGILQPVPKEHTPESEPIFNRFKELTPEEKEFIDEYVKTERSKPYSSPWGEVQSCTTIANGIYSVSTDGHGGIMIKADLAMNALSEAAITRRTDLYAGYFCYEEDCDASIPLRELYDKGILQRDNAYFKGSYVNLGHTDKIDDYVPFTTLTGEQKEQFFKEWDKGVDESLQRWHPDYWKTREEAGEKNDGELTPEQRKIKEIADKIVKKGTENTTEGNWIVLYDELGDDEDFAREHREEISVELERRKEVSDVMLAWDGFDTNFYLDFCPNYEWKEGELTPDERKIKQIADGIIEEGIAKTRTGFWRVEYAQFKNDEQFVREHIKELEAELLRRRTEVAGVTVNDEYIETLHYIVDCPNYQGESVATDKGNTDLSTVGFDQKELGGAKARFKGNVAAIKLVNRLYAENRDPTAEEKKILAQFVGWGGLSQAFDERNEDWRREYAELKALLSDEDYERAKGSTLNAHYTSKEVIDGIYHALDRFGVKGNNRILEPAMGTGNFFGYMPQEIAAGSKLYGVELDNLTGRIAAKLYPQANVQIKGFEDTSFPNDRFDVVVGNVPFGGYGVFDSDYNKHNFYIHDYFLAKSIDKLKAGGVMAVVTSKGTMDKLNPKARKYLADRAELLGAVRLPYTAFKQTANTEVITDILFFRKREERINADTENTEWLSTGKTDEGYEINNYFINHPEMILGTLAKEHGLYNSEDITVKPFDRPLTEVLTEAIDRMPQGFFQVPETSPEAEQTTEVDYNVKPLCYKAESGRLYMRMGEEMVEQPIPKYPKDAYQRITAMIALRDELHHILDIQIQGCSDEVLALEQRKLNARYDAFVKKYGNLNSQTNTKLFKEDGDSALLFACEDIDEETKAISKADIFSKRTIRPYTAVTSTDDCFEALQISKNERGRVDIEYIEELTKKDYDTVLEELGDSVFRDPTLAIEDDKYSGFQTAEEYLSGKVVDKLQTARSYAAEHPEYQKNVDALERVQPTPLTASEISVRLGASWVDKSYYEEFYRQLIGLEWYYRHDVQLFYNPHDSSWRLDQKEHVRNSTYMMQKEVYGTKRAPAYRLFEDCMNLRATTIYDTIQDENGKDKRVLNQAETIAAREKQNKIKEEFAKWIFATPERREELELTYNALFNRIRLPSYDGSYLKFPEMNPAIELKPHQKDAVHRIITGDGSTLLHHVVGAGKTYTMIASIMKMRQYGLCNKAMVAVPNHLVQQWAAEWRKLYPNAKLLIATKEDLEKDNRRRFVSKCAMGDWDGIIIAQSSFAKIPVSTERQIQNLQREITRIEMTVEKTWEENEMPRGAVKNLERIKKSKEAQLKKLMDSSDKDSVLNFESLGVDYLYIDEAHYYKNLFLYSKMNNVAGISSAASQRASDLKLKCEYLQELHGSDRGIVFATGTPISNSMTEMYTMQSYLQPSVLQDVGINFFDGWAADFGETVTSLELAPSGQGYKARTRFAKFTNLPELLTLYRSFADVQTADMVKLDVPEAERITVNLKPSDTVVDLAEEIARRADRINLGGVDPHIDNMLKVTSDGKKLALDPRCYVDTAIDEQGSKINECASRVYEIWEQSTEKKGTQIVFCDLSTPKSKFEEYEYGKDFDAYNDLKYKLVERGVPPEEIAFIHDANTDEQKQALFDKVNSGAVRVLIGSTEKCGAGTNVQKRLVALHHLDTPYRPSDMQQREGRIIRQGNTNDKVQIFTYVTERTFDSYSYQILENKQRFISQIDRGDLTVREAEDIDDRTLSYAEIKAITAADPRIKRKMEVDAEVARLRMLEGQYRKNLYALQDKIRKNFPEDIRRQELLIERVREDTAMLKEKYNPEVFSINVNGVVYTDKKEGGKALTEALYASRPNTTVAEFGGFKISIDPIALIGAERTVTIAGSGQYGMNIGQSASGNLTRFENFFAEFPSREERMIKKLEQLRQDLKIAEEEVTKPFEHEQRLADLLKEQSELNAELNLDKREEVVIEDDKESDTANGGSYMALPEQEVRTPKGRPRKRLNSYATEQIRAQKEKHPQANIFYKNGDGYDLIGEQAERIATENGLPFKTETVDGESYSILSVKPEELDKYVSQLEENGVETLVVEPNPQAKEADFIEDEDKVAAMQVDVLPDYTLTQEQMNKNGYSWNGMLPIRKRTAKGLLGLVTLYALNDNDTESEIKSEADLETHTGYIGVEKPDWNDFLASKQGCEYLLARMSIVTAYYKTLTEEMRDITATSNFEPFIKKVKEEMDTLQWFVSDKPNIDVGETKAYFDDLLEEHAMKMLGVPYEAHGWSESEVMQTLVSHIGHPRMRGFADQAEQRLFEEQEDITTEDKERYEQAMREENPKDFADEDPFTAALLDDIESKGNYKEKTKQGYPVLAMFEDGERKYAILRRNRSDGGKDYIVARGYDDTRGEWGQGDYDFTSYQAAEEYLKQDVPRAEQIDDFKGISSIYRQIVQDSVHNEFTAYKEEMLKSTTEEVFLNNYKIHIYTELNEVIQDGEYLSDKDFRALYEERGSILSLLYDEFIDGNGASVESYAESADFIREYNKHFHEDIMEQPLLFNGEQPYYFGKDDGTAYYFLPALNRENLAEIKERAEKYVIVAPVCYLSKEQLAENKIKFLKLDRDISETDLTKPVEDIERMKLAVMRSAPLYTETGQYALEHGEIAEYKESRRVNGECKQEIDRLIGENHDGEHLKKEFVKGLIDKYGAERLAYVFATTIRESDWDRRYSAENRKWAESIVISDEQHERSELHLAAHPILVNAIADEIRKEYEKRKDDEKEDLSSISEQNNEEKESRDMENTRANVQTNPQEKPRQVSFKVSKDALIKRYPANSRFMMPKGSDYEGCSYSVFNSRIKESTITTDLKSDTREPAFTITLPEDSKVELYEGGEKIMDFYAREFADMVDNTTSEQYGRAGELYIDLPREAVVKRYENSVLMAMPATSELKGYVYYLPNAVVDENTQKEDGSLVAHFTGNFKITLRKGDERVELSGDEFASICKGTTAEDYKRAPTAMDEYREQQENEDNKWKTIPLNENAVLHRYQYNTLLKMPKGDYEGLVCYIPNGFIKENGQGMNLRLPDDFIAHLKDGDKQLDLNASAFASAFENKTDEDFASKYRKPSEETVKQFETLEKNLRANVPEEMKAKPNWVIVRTSENEETGRLEKWLIDVHTDKAAKSNDPTTWTDFDTACQYAKENGGVALAYALDGTDNIACIDLDDCIDENGEKSQLAKDVLSRCGKTYIEISVSGKGLHIFGKTKGMDVRSFSKDGDAEFYQSGHFIAMTGNGTGYLRLESLDKPEMKSLIESKFEKRSEWKGVGAGVEGLSQMDDREVLERAMNAKNGDTFKRLYNGEDLRNNHSNSDMSLMNQLAFWCAHDKEQMLRIFATSGLYRPDKPQSYYEATAIKAVRTSPAYTPPKASNSAPKGSESGNSKA